MSKPTIRKAQGSREPAKNESVTDLPGEKSFLPPIIQVKLIEKFLQCLIVIAGSVRKQAEKSSATFLYFVPP
jgi:hypothetical protein